MYLFYTNFRLLTVMLCSLLLNIVFCTVSRAQITRYVSMTGTTAPAAATSWATSTTDLQGAIDASQAGDQVWVASGVYKPTTTTNRDISFSMKAGVAIYGGFAGTETALSQRPTVNPVSATGRFSTPGSSTLSGDLNGDDGPNFTNRNDNSYHVINNPASLSLTNTAILNGFVITGGNANNSSVGGAGIFGGGILNQRLNSPSLINCVLQNNQADNGGAIFNLDNASPGLINCLLQNNQASYGGAITNSVSSTPRLTNCVVQNNTAVDDGRINGSGYGGAIYNSNNARPVLTNCVLQNNTASSGGAIYSINFNNLVLTNSVLWNNGGEKTINNINNSSVTASYSLFDNTVTGYSNGPGNITTTTSPFIAATSVALAACSPAINAGNPLSITVTDGPYSETALPATDLTGSARITGTRIDMGAVEYQNPNGVPPQIVQQPVASSVICAGTTVVISVSVTGSSPAYQWYKSGTALTGIASATTASLTLTKPSVTVTAAPSATLSCTNPSLTLTAQASATALGWNSGGSTGQTLPVSQTGVYSVTVTNANGCTAVSNSLTISRDNTSPTVSISAIS
ncbi:choice-of-anchor Q domain-containing protein [Arsenicibacter rosenii]|uniref:Ig-like domain-containing protein n=1 Tax=Arsenicibacter rosenii TaxID=1750698 RepID=A0A1S2VA51_9BACT|nr:choice-of-anchor Q domain-containing protein [Arsenicibacter rosenii]OIN55593.1 hypothetical protein BLX24_29285 [Arsenicibacter rosenii]